jgi:prolyl-tRNA synthetase
VRWEMRTRLFLRTSEFLWQEGHTVHATDTEAMEEARRMLEVYREVAEDVLAVPVLAGRKSPAERFPGAEETFTIEGLMRDGKALQSGTSHFLGQNFARAYDVTFLDAQGEQQYGWGTSWGWSTRTVGAVIMTHGDDKGLRLPPAVAPFQVVIVPIYRSDEDRSTVLRVADKIKGELVANSVKARVDDRDQYRPGFKFSEWELKGIPVRIEIGPRDVEAGQVVIADRVTGDKETISIDDAVSGMAGRLDQVQRALFEDAKAFRASNTHDASSYEALIRGIEESGGFWVGPWCGELACEEKVTVDSKATIRTLPLEPEDPGGECVVCGKKGVERATWARAY